MSGEGRLDWFFGDGPSCHGLRTDGPSDDSWRTSGRTGSCLGGRGGWRAAGAQHVITFGDDRVSSGQAASPPLRLSARSSRTPAISSRAISSRSGVWFAWVQDPVGEAGFAAAVELLFELVRCGAGGRRRIRDLARRLPARRHRGSWSRPAGEATTLVGAHGEPMPGSR
jgi:hypothetical protein